MIEYNDEYDAVLRDLVENHPRSYFKTIKAKSNVEILKYIEGCTPLLSDEKYLISTKVFWVLNRLQDFPRCKMCGKPILRNVKINEGYPSHCCARCLANDPEVQKHKEDACQRKYGEGIINPFQAEEVIKKIDETNLRKYNVRRYTQTEEYRNKITRTLDDINERKYETHRMNNSFNESKTECIVKSLLEKKFKCVKHQYKSEKYPFECDFYVDDIDTYIEFNGTWTHGGHPFDDKNPEDLKTVETWRSKGTEYYSNAIYTWTDLDVRKRNVARQNGIKILEFWDLFELENWLGLGESRTSYPYNRKKIEREFQYYRDRDVDELTPYISHKNEIVKYFQQDTFFKKEKELWNDKAKREKLLENRLKYLGKSESDLAPDDILTGFKKSGIYYGYSHFNPLWFKWFMGNYGAKSCYDPCGGWGHRLLGGLDLDLYIYNDYSPETKRNVDRIVEYFKIKNTKTYNEDASRFNPDEKFDAMFTCPPYFNTEHYECGDFKDRKEFDRFIDSLFDVFNSHKECKIFGLVIRDDLLGRHTDYKERFLVNKKDPSYLDEKDNNNDEHMFVFRK